MTLYMCEITMMGDYSGIEWLIKTVVPGLLGRIAVAAQVILAIPIHFFLYHGLAVIFLSHLCLSHFDVFRCHFAGPLAGGPLTDFLRWRSVTTHGSGNLGLNAKPKHAIADWSQAVGPVPSPSECRRGVV